MKNRIARLLGKKKQHIPFPEEKVMAMFPWNETSPEEYAAKRAHRIGAFDLDSYEFNNKKFGDWINRFGPIVRDTDKMEECRKKFLSAAEYQKVQEEIQQIIQHGGV